MASKHNKHEAQATKARLQMFEAKRELENIKTARRSRDNRLALVISGAALVLVVALQSAYFGFGPGHTVAAEATATPTNTPSASSSPSATPSSSTSATAAPAANVSQSKEWVGQITLNSQKLAIQLDGKAAPKATANFLSLAAKKFFDNTKCHRLTNSGVFILQCGDPTATGTGGPGYSFGPIENAPLAKLSGGSKLGLYPAGTIAMARQSNNANSQGSQFFIVYKDSYFPEDQAGGYTIFGKITSGLKLLDSYIKQGVSGGSGDGTPNAQFLINSIRFPLFKESTATSGGN